MKIVVATIMTLIGLCGHAVCSAADYPTKPIRFIVGYLQGGGNDIIARLVGAKLQEALGQPVIIENRPGADTIIAAEFVAKSAPDGYTILVNAMGGMTVTPALHAKLPYDPLKDFVPISIIARFPHVLAVNPSVPVGSVTELVAYAKANPRKLNYGSSGTAMQLVTEMFAQMTGISLTHIPYKGSSASVQALVSNEVQLAIADLPPMLPHIKTGRVKTLAVTSADRMKAMPSLPTFVEAAGLTGFDISPWVGLFAPAGTPAAVITSLNSQLIRLVKLPDVEEKLSFLGAEPVGDSPEQAANRLRADIKRFDAAARMIKINAR